MGRLKRIALYGGSFDPVHVGHLSVAQRLMGLFALDEILFIPAHVAPHKRGAPPASALHRYAMLALATQHEPRFRVSTVELDEPERPYTVDTLSRFQREVGGTSQLFFIMGADSWMEITTWREWERVLTMIDHIVVTRPGSELDVAHVTAPVRERIVDLRGAEPESVEQVLEGGVGARIYLTDAVKVNVSSSAIRRAAAQGMSDRGAGTVALVPPPVADYIRKYRLYREVHETELFDAGNDPAHD